ncbi:MAG: PAS domain-containing protein [Proteobacteria bacterium]|nr:PAS domain-containing protein [Pseudomonadota bacterium]MBU1649975.1 PAS domain-containing protein [Pseudomonadota bacterium]
MENSETAIAMENKQRQAYFIAGLAETIRAQKIAQKDLAVKAQISAVTLSKVLNGKQGCSQEWRNKVSKPLNITEEELVKKGAVITAATHPTIQGEVPLSEKLASAALPENVIETTEQGRALPIEEIFQVLRDKFQDTEAEAKEAKAHMIRCYEVFEALHDSITIVSSDRKIMYQNHASILFLGRHHGEDYDTVLAEIVPDYSPYELLLQKTFDLNTPHIKEVSTNNGTYMVNMLPVAGDMGRVDRVVIIARPVSKNYQDQSAQARTQAAFNALDFSLIIFDQDRNLVRKNRTFCNMLNLNGQEIKTFDDLQTVASRMDNAGEVLTRMYKVFDQKIQISGKCIHPDGKVLWQELTPLFGNDGEFLGVACQLRPWTGQEA